LPRLPALQDALYREAEPALSQNHSGFANKFEES